MTREEEKVLNYLNIMEITPDHEIDRMELKGKYLTLEKKYYPNELYNDYKDSTEFFKMKDAYDYLYDHIELVNETIHNLLYPKEEVNENYNNINNENPNVFENNEIPNQTFTGFNQAPVIVKDRPSMIAVLFSLLSPIMGFLMFILHRKITPKSSWLYLVLGILGLALNILVLTFYMGQL